MNPRKTPVLGRNKRVHVHQQSVKMNNEKGNDCQEFFQAFQSMASHNDTLQFALSEL